MKFSEALTEYLQLREDEREETGWTPIPLRRERSRRKAELLEEMDRITFGVTTVPINRPATMEEANHAARIGACLPNGVLFDAFGRERVRYVRVIHDGTTCVVRPGDVADMIDSECPDDYRTEDVYLSKEEFDALPEFDGF
jgi:hypothetical protein